MVAANKKNRNKRKPAAARPSSKAVARPWLLSRPLEALVFLLPLILFYEIGCVLMHRAPSGAAGQERVVAFHLMRVFFDLFGTAGRSMPGLAVVAILLCTHIVSGQPWSVRRRSVGWMYAESVLLAVPLLAFSYTLQASRIDAVTGSGVFTDVVLGVGAGVYEELVFRLILISLIVMVGADFLGWSSRLTNVVAVVISALAFSAHHHPPLGSDPFSVVRFAFRAVAGAYLAVLFIYRGYGPAAGAHAAYNVLVALG